MGVVGGGGLEGEAEGGPGRRDGGGDLDVVYGVVEERLAARVTTAGAVAVLLLDFQGQDGDEEDGQRRERGEDDGGRQARCCLVVAWCV